MHPAPTELERLHPRKTKFIRHSPFYLAAMLGFFLTDGPVSRAVKRSAPLSDWIWLAVISATALGFWLWLGERDTMKSEDELEQRIRTEALANALPFTIGVAFLLIRLGQSGVRLELFPGSDASWLALLLPYGVSLFIARRRYQ